MNTDKLLKIAKLLDEINHFALADKVDKIAQNAQTNIYDYNNNPNAGETWYNRAGRIFSGNATIYDYPGLANSLKHNDQVGQRLRERNRRLRSNQNPQQNQPQQPQQPQQQSPLLVSTTPQQFVNNLLQFGQQNNLSDLAQTMDAYANQGGTYNGQPINQNQQAKNLYNQVKNNPGFLSQQQILLMLTGAGR
jgi:hypothetical protein